MKPPEIAAFRKELASLSKRIKKAKEAESPDKTDLGYARWMILHSAESSVDSADTALCGLERLV